ncbi:germacrene-D synthase-like [Forsythia ovata]|uniref:Germacrene-D synthase-like n=1 Tax=Forsythia ovata TaxID=205694 RepID=A0ABD1UXC2_9LAMI
MKKLVRAYFKEAKWTYDGYVPTIEKYMKVALVSGAYMMLSTSSLVGMGELATKEAFEWISSEPLLVRASSIICRLMDDMVGHGPSVNSSYFVIVDNGSPEVRSKPPWNVTKSGRQLQDKGFLINNLKQTESIFGVPHQLDGILVSMHCRVKRFPSMIPFFIGDEMSSFELSEATLTRLYLLAKVQDCPECTWLMYDVDWNPHRQGSTNSSPNPNLILYWT